MHGCTGKSGDVSRWICEESENSVFCSVSRISQDGCFWTKLLNHLGDDAGADGASAFAYREPQALFHRDRRDQLTVIWMLSPGITISTPSGSVTAPVTSVVRK